MEHGEVPVFLNIVTQFLPFHGNTRAAEKRTVFSHLAQIAQVIFVAESCSQYEKCCEKFCTVDSWIVLQGKGTKGDGTLNYFTPKLVQLV